MCKWDKDTTVSEEVVLFRKDIHEVMLINQICYGKCKFACDENSTGVKLVEKSRNSLNMNKKLIPFKICYSGLIYKD